jgi:hypothetical protein
MTDTTNKALLGMLQAKFPNYHPVIAMAELAHGEDVDNGIKLNCHKEIAKYIEPQLKSVEHKGTVKSDFGVLRVVPAETLAITTDPVDINGASASSEAA